MAEQQEKANTTSSRRGLPVEILPNLWLGALASLKCLSDHERKSWTVISVLGSDKLVSMCNFMIQEAKTNQRCKRHILWKLDDKNDSKFFSDELMDILLVMDETLQPKDAAQGDILVHCAMGVSRSVTLCAAWIMSRKKLLLQNTMDMIRNVRPEAMPNLGFIASLRALEASDFDVQKARQRLGQDAGGNGDF